MARWKVGDLVEVVNLKSGAVYGRGAVVEVEADKRRKHARVDGVFTPSGITFSCWFGASQLRPASTGAAIEGAIDGAARCEIHPDAEAAAFRSAIEGALSLLCRLRDRGVVGAAPEIEVLGRWRALLAGDGLALRALAKVRRDAIRWVAFTDPELLALRDALARKWGEGSNRATRDGLYGEVCAAIDARPSCVLVKGGAS